MASSSSGRNGSGPSCPICLQPFQREAYLDRCFHAFCYNCIIRWSEVVSEKHSSPLSSIKCPLCKMENFSIIHAFDGESFQRHYVNQAFKKSFFSSAHEFRLQCYNNEIPIATGITDMFDVQQYWKQHKYLHKNIWLQSWLKREIQTLIQEEDVDIMIHHVHGVVDSFMRSQDKDDIMRMPEEKSREFRALVSSAVMPFLHGKTERFVTELEMFLASGLNIEAYDRVCMQWLGIPASSEPRDRDASSCDQPGQYQYMYFLSEDADRAD